MSIAARPVQHPDLPELPDHLPVLVQAYPELVDLGWVALHGSLAVEEADLSAPTERATTAALEATGQ